jgi:DNA-binding beta-propeller fold protein YncE
LSSGIGGIRRYLAPDSQNRCSAAASGRAHRPFSADVSGHRLFVSALGNRSIEIIDAQTFRLVHSIPNFDEPQGIVFDNVANRLFVASGGDGTVKVLNATNFQRIL